jgi:glycerol-3-phosphate O-acyltransferase / dihydroxyacetone phosphate acyltransferase
LRHFFRALFRLALRIFFRRIEIEGTERIPTEGPVIFVVNHPNSLIDPLFLLCFAPRRVSFLAKAPLFKMPLIGFFTRRFDSIPVHRRQDGNSDPARNRETFESARQLLARGASLALFPEGASHDEPRLLALKTGAARIALGAAAQGKSSLEIVPTLLAYTWKKTFRSSVLLSFGEPLRVEPAPLDRQGEPLPDAVRQLTGRIERALSERALQAETHEALDLVRRAERIFSIETRGETAELAQQLELRRRFVEGHRRLKQQDPLRLAEIETRIARFETERREAGLGLEHLEPERLGTRAVANLIGRNLGSLALLPLAAAGALLHYPVYRLVGFLATRIAKEEEDVLATAKVASSMLLFPLTWLAASIAAGKLFGVGAAAATLLLAPLSGYAALRAAESLDQLIGRARALAGLAFSGSAVKRLLTERHAIREQILRVAEELELVTREP